MSFFQPEPDNDHSGDSRLRLSMEMLGSVFLILAVTVVISQYWDFYSTLTRALVFLGGVLLINLIGLFFYQIDQAARAVIFFFLGGIVFDTGLESFLDHTYRHPGLIDVNFWWAIGVLPLAVLTKSTLLMFLGAFAALIWVIYSLEYSVSPDEMWIFLLVLGWYCLSVKKSRVVMSALFLLSLLWIQGMSSGWLGSGGGFGYGLLNLSALGGGLLIWYALSLAAGKENSLRQEYSRLLYICSAFTGLLILMILGIDKVWEVILEQPERHAGLVVGSVALPAVVALAIVRICGLKVWPMAASAGLVILAMSAAAFASADNALMLGLIFSITMFLLAAAIMIDGSRRGDDLIFFFGLIAILANAQCQVFARANLTAAALTFIICAIALFATAHFYSTSKTPSRTTSADKKPPPEGKDDNQS